MIKKLLGVAGLLLGACLSASAQNGVRYDNYAFATVTGGNGVIALPGALVTVCTSASTGNPCTPTTPVYSDAAMTVPFTLSQITTDAGGNFGFYIPPGRYTYTIRSSSGLTGGPFPFTAGMLPDTTNTFSNFNGILYVGSATGQYASLQAAHDAAPSAGANIFVTGTGTPFGGAGTTALAATKPMHVIFDCANFTYSGAAAQAISTTSRGVIIEGCGRRGDDTGTAGTTITISNTAANGIANSGNGATFRDFNLIGPASGTGKGVINTAGRATYMNLNISGWGSDGWTDDGSATNANTVLVLKVRSSNNGGNGFVTKGVNGQLVAFIETDGSGNTGDGYNVANQLNVFQATNADANTGCDYHFLSGGILNSGTIFSNNAIAGPPGGICFDAGANNNYFTQTGAANIVTDAGTNNLVYFPGNQTWSGLTATPRFSSLDANLTFHLNSGNGGATRGSTMQFENNGTNKWYIQKSTTDAFNISDAVAAIPRFQATTSSLTQIESGGSSAVRFNDVVNAATGTGGVESYSGGAASAKTAQITGGGLLVDVNAVTPCTNGELALSAGWQSSGAATVTAVLGTGQTCSWTITTGTTTAANPTITDTLTNALPTATTVCWMNIYGGTHVAVAGESLRQTTLSATAPIFTANFTPTNTGATYFVTRGCGP